MQDYHIIKDRIDTLVKLLQNDNLCSYDPYDSLNSTFLQSISLASKKPLFRLFWTQFFKQVSSKKVFFDYCRRWP